MFHYMQARLLGHGQNFNSPERLRWPARVTFCANSLEFFDTTSEKVGLNTLLCNILMGFVPLRCFCHADADNMLGIMASVIPKLVQKHCVTDCLYSQFIWHSIHDV